jgi:hypothetical protein
MAIRRDLPHESDLTVTGGHGLKVKRPLHAAVSLYGSVQSAKTTEWRKRTVSCGARRMIRAHLLHRYHRGTNGRSILPSRPVAAANVVDDQRNAREHDDAEDDQSRIKPGRTDR